MEVGDVIAGYFWLLVYIVLFTVLVLLTVRVFSGGPRHPHFRGRALAAWSALAFPVALISFQFRFPPTSLLVAAFALALLWPLGRFGVASIGPFARSVLVLGGVLLLATVGLSATTWYGALMRMPPGDCSLIENLRPSQARADAERAVSRGDLHLFEVFGITSWVPGVGFGEQGNKPIRAIPCTSDALVSSRHARLNGVAIAYASAYNRRVVELAPRTHGSSD